MKEKNKYHIADIVNIIVFYCVATCFVVALIMGIVQYAQGDLELKKVLFRTSFVLLMCVPYLIKKVFKVTFSRVVSIIFYLYMFLAAFLGNVLEFYITMAEWDMFIHFLMGMALSVLSIYLLNATIYKKDKSRHNMFFTAIFMIIFAMGVGALWEIWEFCGDLIFDINAQKYLKYGELLVGREAIFDTMMDLVMDFLGAITGVVFTFVMIKINKRFLKTFTIKKLRDSEQEIENIEE